MAKLKLLLATFLVTAGLAACAPGASDEQAVEHEEEASGTEEQEASSNGGGAEWLTDFPEVLTEAREKQRQILINFTGSDWCGPCIYMKEHVFSTPEFQEYAEENLVLLEVDFPRRRELPEEQMRHNAAVLQLYRVEPFPTYIVADEEGRPLKRMEGLRGAMSPAQFIAWLEE